MPDAVAVPAGRRLFPVSRKGRLFICRGVARRRDTDVCAPCLPMLDGRFSRWLQLRRGKFAHIFHSVLCCASLVDDVPAFGAGLFLRCKGAVCFEKSAMDEYKIK